MTYSTKAQKIQPAFEECFKTFHSASSSFYFFVRIPGRSKRALTMSPTKSGSIVSFTTVAVRSAAAVLQIGRAHV